MTNENGNGNGNGNGFVPMDSVMGEMAEESKKGGTFFKMSPTEQKTIEVISDPVASIRTYDKKEGEKDKGPKKVFQFKVKENNNQEVLTWEVGNKQLMAQLVGIQRNFGLKTWAGAKMIVSTVGTTAMDKRWSLTLISAQGYQNPMFQSAPVADPAGAAWVQSQKVGAN